MEESSQLVVVVASTRVKLQYSHKKIKSLPLRPRIRDHMWSQAWLELVFAVAAASYDRWSILYLTRVNNTVKELFKLHYVLSSSCCSFDDSIFRQLELALEIIVNIMIFYLSHMIFYIIIIINHQSNQRHVHGRARIGHAHMFTSTCTRSWFNHKKRMTKHYKSILNFLRLILLISFL